MQISRWMGVEKKPYWPAVKDGLQCEASFHYRLYNPHELSVQPNSSEIRLCQSNCLKNRFHFYHLVVIPLVLLTRLWSETSCPFRMWTWRNVSNLWLLYSVCFTLLNTSVLVFSNPLSPTWLRKKSEQWIRSAISSFTFKKGNCWLSSVFCDCNSTGYSFCKWFCGAIMSYGKIGSQHFPWESVSYTLDQEWGITVWAYSSYILRFIF